MAIMDHNFSSQSTGFVSSLASSLKNQLNRIGQYYTYKNTVKELQKLSDRELEDVGLCRGDISDAVKGLVYKR